MTLARRNPTVYSSLVFDFVIRISPRGPKSLHASTWQPPVQLVKVDEKFGKAVPAAERHLMRVPKQFDGRVFHWLSGGSFLTTIVSYLAAGLTVALNGNFLLHHLSKLNILAINEADSKHMLHNHKKMTQHRLVIWY